MMAMTTRMQIIFSLSMIGLARKRETSESSSCPCVFRTMSMSAVFRYLILDVLGQGTFGQVVKCQNMKTHEIVAVKVVKNKPAYFNQSMMEVTILDLVSSSSKYMSGSV